MTPSSIKDGRTPASRRLLASGLAYTAVTLLMARHLVASLASTFAADRVDPALSAAILAWNALHFPGSDRWFDFPSFHPAADVLTLSEHMLGVSVVSAPIYWLTGDALIAYNITFLATYVLSGATMFALVWYLTRHTGASFLAGLAYAFAPYRAGHMGHIQVLAVFWAPVALLGLHGFLKTGRWTWLVVFGLCWMLQGAANGYLLVFMPVLVAAWVAWFVLRQRRWRDAMMIGAAGAAGVLPLVPLLVRYVEVHTRDAYSRSLDEIIAHSADVASVLCAPVGSSIWAWLREANCGGERELFPGVTIVAVCAAALWAVRRRHDPASETRATAGFYLLMVPLMWTLTWGPVPTLYGRQVLPQGPYAWLMVLPGFDQLRVPARFWTIAVLCLCVAMGVLAAAALRRSGRWTTRIAVVAAAVGLLADGWAPVSGVELLPVAPRPDLIRGGVAMHLPLGAALDRDAGAQFEAIEGGWRTANGYSGYFPRHYQLLRESSARADPALLSPFLSRGDLHVVMYESWPAQDALVEGQPGAKLVGRGNGLRQYVIPRQGELPPSVPRGTRHSIDSISASCVPENARLLGDGDRGTRWGCGPQSPDQQVTVDLGDVASIGDVVTTFGEAWPEYPRHLIVETSLDGNAWNEAWNRGVLPETFEALVKDPTRARVVLTFPPRQGRYVRLRLGGAFEPSAWSMAELEIWSGE